jgi:hypothetical protein
MVPPLFADYAWPGSLKSPGADGDSDGRDIAAERKPRRCGGSNVNLSISGIVLGIFLSLVGIALLSYGRKEVRIPHMVVGGILLVYPYFIGNWIAVLVIAAFLVGGLALISRLGY